MKTSDTIRAPVPGKLEWGCGVWEWRGALRSREGRKAILKMTQLCLQSPLIMKMTRCFHRIFSPKH